MIVKKTGKRRPLVGFAGGIVSQILRINSNSYSIQQAKPFIQLTPKVDNMTSKLDRLFGSRTRVLLLSKLMLNPDSQFHIRELSKILNIPYGMVHREIKNLVSLGILREEKRGKITLISVNKNLPYFNELKSLIVKTTGIADIVREALSGMEGIRYALIFGSFARGDETESSDVDLLIVGDADEEKILRRISQAEKQIGREINYILWSEEEFARKIKNRHHLLMDIVNNPVIMLIGEENEFRRAVEG